MPGAVPRAWGLTGSRIDIAARPARASLDCVELDQCLPGDRRHSPSPTSGILAGSARMASHPARGVTATVEQPCRCLRLGLDPRHYADGAPRPPRDQHRHEQLRCSTWKIGRHTSGTIPPALAPLRLHGHPSALCLSSVTLTRSTQTDHRRPHVWPLSPAITLLPRGLHKVRAYSVALTLLGVPGQRRGHCSTRVDRY